ncbi:Protein OPI10 -like protein [Halotydeus destructor]|nr:Protein OPI10 -like protein [Halotydeus destructor]
MFGVVVSGRLPQVDFENVDQNKFLITIPEAGSINHVVVFMTGSAAFPPGMGASVYFSWPDPNMPPSWQYLGILSNDKPSAIYKITKLKGFGDSQRNSFDYISPLFPMWHRLAYPLNH